MKIFENFSLKSHNTFGVNVKAKKFVSVTSEKDVIHLLENSEIDLEPLLVLGGGSNILFTKDYDGIVLKSEIDGIRIISRDDNHVYLEVGSGVIWDHLVEYCVSNNFGGIENLSLIPGTVGAAPIQNIGAYGAELQDVFHELEAIIITTGEKIVIDKNQCKFGYRESVFKNELKGKSIITKVILKLDLSPSIISSHIAVWDSLTDKEKNDDDIRRVRELIISIRKSKLPDPLEIGNAGSFFKNPIVTSEHFNFLEEKYGKIINYKVGKNIKIPAGWLIEKAGFKGKRVREVGVHNKQALVLVNYGNGTGQEILNLAYEIHQEILDKFNINLETEVNIL